MFTRAHASDPTQSNPNQIQLKVGLSALARVHPPVLASSKRGGAKALRFLDPEKSEPCPTTINR
jgi:hypothetical protein